MTVMWVKIINYQFIHSIKFTSNEKIILVKPIVFSCFRIITVRVRDRNKCCHNLPAGSLILAWISLDRRREGGREVTQTRGEENNNRREERDQALHLSAPTVQDNFTLVQLNCPAAPALAPFNIK